MNTKKWTCKDGRKIRIKDMKTSHLVSVINMLEANHQNEIAHAYMFSGSLRGEMAIMDAEQGIDMMEDCDSMHPLYGELLEELSKRPIVPRWNGSWSGTIKI